MRRTRIRTPWVARTAIALMALAACGPAGESADACERLEARMEKCGSELPLGAAVNLRMYCKISMRYEPEPGDGPNNLAALTKGALAECAGPTAATCDGFQACLERHGCKFVFTSPGDVTPQFWCSPQPSP